MSDDLTQPPTPSLHKRKSSADMLDDSKKAGIDLGKGQLPEVVHEINTLKRRASQEFWAERTGGEIAAWVVLGVAVMMVGWWL